MGAAAQARARALYDWSVVIPQMQALWAEQAAMLAHGRSKGGAAIAPRDAGLAPIGPAPEEMFAAYPTRRAPETRRLRATDPGVRPGPVEMIRLRNYVYRRRFIEDAGRIETILAAYRAAGPAGADEGEIAVTTGLARLAVARSVMWLLKYDYLAEVA
jgi:hypothetical protein